MTIGGPELADQWPLDFTLQYPPRREYFQQNFLEQIGINDADCSLVSPIKFPGQPFG
jgi:hypothetical protein